MTHNKGKIFEEDIVDSTRDKIVLYGGATFERMLVSPKDGLKPVNRRILYLLWEEKVHQHEKMATLAGSVLKYHPHGDSSVSDAMSKMGQWFYMNYPLIDPQGNYGTLDGDPPSAPRYIEARPSEFARDVLIDEIDSQCVDYQDNYDYKRKEPINLPAKLPLVLVQGSEGIAVAFAASIPPHNLADVIDRTIRFIKNPSIDNEVLVEGLYPDFPTGGEIVNGLEVKANYTKGVPCSIRIRAKLHADLQNSTVIVEELPFGVTFDKVTAAIIKSRKEKKEESPFVDYLRVTPNNRNNTWEIEFKKGSNINQAILDLLAYTPLETSRTLSIIVNDNGSPKQMTIKELIAKWYEFRLTVKKRKLTF
jgi:DNA gyrase subunit A